MMTVDAIPLRRDTARQRAFFGETRRAETMFARSLRKIADGVQSIVDKFPNIEDLGDEEIEEITHQMHAYSDKLRPWADAAARRMLGDVVRRDEAAWNKIAQGMSRDLRNELRSAPTGAMLRGLLEEQVHLITSLPLDAAERVHKMTLEARADGTRASQIADAIRRSGAVTKSRANLIARTEVARTASGLVMARAQHVGSDGYVWRTAQDSDVRPIHKRLNGKFFRWDAPPIAGERGERAHAGSIYNCRCFPEPVIPDL